MPAQIQSPSGQKILSDILETFTDNGNEMSFSELCDALSERCGCRLDLTDRSNIASILDAYTGDTIACTSDSDQVLCLFVRVGDGQYELIADPETIDALQCKDDARVTAANIPADGDQMVHFHSKENRESDASALNASDPAASDTLSGLGTPTVYGDDIYDEIDMRESVGADDLQRFSDYQQNASAMDTADNAQEGYLPQEGMTPGIQAEIDSANQAVISARARAEFAEDDARQARAQLEEARKENESLKSDSMISMEEDSNNRKTQKKIRKAADAIRQQERKAEDHERSIEDDATGMMKSMHRAQIRHDKKVIDRKIRKIAKMEANS